MKSERHKHDDELTALRRRLRRQVDEEPFSVASRTLRTRLAEIDRLEAMGARVLENHRKAP